MLSSKNKWGYEIFGQSLFFFFLSAYSTDHFVGLQQLIVVGTTTHGVHYLDPASMPAFWLMQTFPNRRFHQKWQSSFPERIRYLQGWMASCLFPIPPDLCCQVSVTLPLPFLASRGKHPFPTRGFWVAFLLWLLLHPSLNSFLREILAGLIRQGRSPETSLKKIQLVHLCFWKALAHVKSFLVQTHVRECFLRLQECISWPAGKCSLYTLKSELWDNLYMINRLLV